MKPTSIEINIPGAIAALPLTIGEKVVLNHIRVFPCCSNARLAELIGASCRGVENLLRRLRRQGYIERSGKGRARKHYLLFSMEHHSKGGAESTTTSETKSHTLCADHSETKSILPSPGNTPVLQREVPWEEDLGQTLGMIHELCVNHTPFPESIIRMFERALKIVEEHRPEGPAKDGMVKELTRRRDGFVAKSYAMKLPRRDQNQARLLIRQANPEQLAQFRERVETGGLGAKSPLLLATLAGKRNTTTD